MSRLLISPLTGKVLVAQALLLSGTATWAAAVPGGSIDYGPLSTGVAAVPSLSEWMLVLLGLLLAVVAYRALRGRVNGRLLSNLTLAGGALAATVAGHGVIQDAQADLVADEQNMSSPSGGTVTGTNWVQLTNTSGVPLKIKAVRPNEGFRVVSPPELPECDVDVIVLPGNKCNIHFYYLPD